MNETQHTEFSMQRWLEELPDEQIEREMKELNEQIQVLAARANTLREALELKQRFRNLYADRAAVVGRTTVTISDRGLNTDGDTITSGTTVSGQDVPRPSSIGKAVLLLMELKPEKREWTVNDFYSGLVEREWLDDSKQALRSLGAALSRMTSDGELRRLSRGRYAGAASETASPSLLDSEEGASG